MKKRISNDTQSNFDFADLKEDRAHGDSDYPVGIYLVDLDTMYDNSVRWHWHDEAEIVVVTKGKAVFWANDDSFELSEGQGLFLNRNVLHSMRSYEGVHCVFYSIVFHLSLISTLGNTRLAEKYIFPITSNPSLRSMEIDLTEDFHHELLAYANAAYEAHVMKSFGYELQTRKYLTDFWLTILKHQQTKEAEIVNPNTKIFSDANRAKAAITFIQKHYAEPITLTEIAASIHISKGECCRCFKRTVNMSPFEYLMQYRIFMAVSIMSASDYSSFSDLAMQVGFNSSSYFNKVFKKHLNCTPSEYRKKHLLNASAVSLDHSGIDIEELPLFTNHIN